MLLTADPDFSCLSRSGMTDIPLWNPLLRPRYYSKPHYIFGFESTFTTGISNLYTHAKISLHTAACMCLTIFCWRKADNARVVLNQNRYSV